MVRCTRRAVVAGTCGLAAIPWQAGGRAWAQVPREDRRSVDSLLGHHLAWQDPWILREHEPYTELVETIILDAPRARFAFVLHHVMGVESDYRTAATYRDSLTETPERWNLVVLAVFSDPHGEQALLVDRNTDQVYYYCVSPVNADYLLELGFYAGLASFEESWDLARAISLDGTAVFDGFDEASILGPVAARARARPDVMPADATQTYLVALWAFYVAMRTNTDRIAAARDAAPPGDDGVAAIAALVAGWTRTIRDLHATVLPGPEFAEVDAIARDTADAYTRASRLYGSIAGERDLARSLGWSAFLDQLATAEGLLQQLKGSLDEWGVPSLTA
ncbi:MAG: hypothetical protein WBA46_07295 [Thermomicrobiales bacterium]